MSVFDRQMSGAPTNTHGQPTALEARPAVAFMGDALSQSEKPPTSRAVDPHRDTRAIVRLVQCSQCSLPLHNPLTLPCGNSLCRTCLPELHTRTNITFPAEPNRKEGFMCPFDNCRKDHSLGDCSQDVTLAKVMDRVSIEVARCRPLTTDTPTLLDERPRWKNIVDSSKERKFPSSRILNGGRLVATYTMAEIGELRYDSEVAYQTMSPTGDSYENLDVAMLENLKEATKNELDCQVCYALMLDPLTTTCGHTFCRKCIARTLDHSTMCPICRRFLPSHQEFMMSQAMKDSQSYSLTLSGSTGCKSRGCCTRGNPNAGREECPAICLHTRISFYANISSHLRASISAHDQTCH